MLLLAHQFYEVIGPCDKGLKNWPLQDKSKVIQLAIYDRITEGTFLFAGSGEAEVVESARMSARKPVRKGGGGGGVRRDQRYLPKWRRQQNEGANMDVGRLRGTPAFIDHLCKKPSAPFLLFALKGLT